MSSQASSYQGPSVGPTKSFLNKSSAQLSELWKNEVAAGQQSVDFDHACAEELSRLSCNSPETSQKQYDLENSLTEHAAGFSALFPSINEAFGTWEDYKLTDKRDRWLQRGNNIRSRLPKLQRQLREEEEQEGGDGTESTDTVRQDPGAEDLGVKDELISGMSAGISTDGGGSARDDQSLQPSSVA